MNEIKKDLIGGYIPSEYKEPSSSENYMKFRTGENRIRILSSMIMGWEDWVEKKPVRFRYDEKPDHSSEAGGKIRMFWAFVVWNYQDEKIQILQVTQTSVRKQIHKLASDADWGNPQEYDLKISKQGEELTTQYVVIPCRHAAVSKKIQDAYKVRKINLDALFDGGDPFELETAKPFEAFTPAKTKHKERASA